MKIDASYVEALAGKFENHSLPAAEWTHQAHILVGICNLLNFPEAALEKMRQSIRAYNLSVGTQNTDNAGYHESITQFWLLLLRKFIVYHGHSRVEDVYNGLLQSNLIERTLLFEFYSRERLFSVEARLHWVEPDLQSIGELQNYVEATSRSHYSMSDEALEEALEYCHLNPSFFTHEAHLRIAYIKIRKWGVDEAIKVITSQIENYAKTLGANNKYNLTLTVAAVKTVNHFVGKAKAQSFYELTKEFPRLKYNFRDLISAHYGIDIFNSPTARKAYIEPDILPYT